jgi:hypothetical protein
MEKYKAKTYRGYYDYPIILILLFLLYWINKSDGEPAIYATIILCTFTVVYLLFHYLIHIDYIKHNKNAVLIICKGYYEYKRGKDIVHFDRDDIDRIDYHWRKEIYVDKPALMLWGDFHFARILLKNGKEVIITHFLKPEFRIKDFDNAWMHERYYPHTKWYWQRYKPYKFNEKELKAERNEYKFFPDEEDD